jgi:hypothetical protein
VSEHGPTEAFTLSVHEHLRAPAVEHGFGQADLFKHNGNRRVVWVPMGGSVEPARRSGGRDDGNGNRVTYCALLRPVVAAHIYAPDYASSEELMFAVIAAALATDGEVKFLGFDTVSQEVENAGESRRTQHMRLRMSIPIDVPEEIAPLRAITAVTDICGWLNDDGTVTPQP